MDPNKPNDGDVPIGELLVLCGQGCSVTSCLFTNCFGCTSEGMCLCLRWEMKGCRPVYGKNEHKTCCVLCQSSNECVVPQTCVLVQQQCFCLDTRCAVPCIKEMPCICTGVPFCVCCVNYQLKPACCKKWKELLPPDQLSSSSSVGGVNNVINVVEQLPPVTVQMVRQQPVLQQQYVVQQQQPRMLMVAMPQGTVAGQMITIQTPTGQQLNVTIPQGIMPGNNFQVQY